MEGKIDPLDPGASSRLSFISTAECLDCKTPGLLVAIVHFIVSLDVLESAIIVCPWSLSAG